MPSSPPADDSPRRTAPASDVRAGAGPSVIVRTADSTTDDELLQLIENARTAVEHARRATAPSYVAPPDDHTAATSLFERHASRRDLELEWDERDTQRRASELLARLEQDPPRDDLIDAVPPFVSTRATSVGEMYGFPTFGGILRDSDDDDDGDDWFDPANVEEAIFGFDGDEPEDADMLFDDDDDDDDDEGSPRTAPRLTSVWPGLVGERPLNPANAPSSTSPPADDAMRDARTKLNSDGPRDPSSSTSFTSFLSPGTTFIGQQVTNAREATRRTHVRDGTLSFQRRPRSSLGAAGALRPPTAADEQSASFDGRRSQAIGAFRMPDFASPRAAPSGGSAALSTHGSASAPTDSAMPQVHSATSSARYAPYSSHTAVGTPAATSSIASVPSAPIPPNLTPVERARLSIARSSNPTARSNPANWRQVAEELLGRLGAEGGSPRVEHDQGGGSSRRKEEERWEVQVNIRSYDPEGAALTGLMSAYGIQSSQRDLSRQPTRVTTFFSASIIRPLVDGLFVSPSPTGSGGSSAEGIKVSQGTEAESWIQIGPFKGIKKNDLLSRAKSREWVEDKSRGWVLMRWKERDFVNVKATESSLSINGFYFVALNRSTGVIEGLYSDPASSPHQRLDLSPCNPEGSFSLGTYAMC